MIYQETEWVGGQFYVFFCVVVVPDNFFSRGIGVGWIERYGGTWDYCKFCGPG